jgi:hypothetical protein
MKPKDTRQRAAEKTEIAILAEASKALRLMTEAGGTLIEKPCYSVKRGGLPARPTTDHRIKNYSQRNQRRRR